MFILTEKVEFIHFFNNNDEMKNIFYIFLIMILSLGINADDQEVEHTHENDYEEGCSNDLDDDMDGDIDGDDEDCAAVLALAEDDGIMGGLASDDVSAYLVWGIGIALINSDFGSSGSGTATTD